MRRNILMRSSYAMVSYAKASYAKVSQDASHKKASLWSHMLWHGIIHKLHMCNKHIQRLCEFGNFDESH